MCEWELYVPKEGRKEGKGGWWRRRKGGEVQGGMRNRARVSWVGRVSSPLDWSPGQPVRSIEAGRRLRRVPRRWTRRAAPPPSPSRPSYKITLSLSLSLSLSLYFSHSLFLFASPIPNTFPHPTESQAQHCARSKIKIITFWSSYEIFHLWNKRQWVRKLFIISKLFSMNTGRLCTPLCLIYIEYFSTRHWSTSLKLREI